MASDEFPRDVGGSATNGFAEKSTKAHGDARLRAAGAELRGRLRRRKKVCPN